VTSTAPDPAPAAPQSDVEPASPRRVRVGRWDLADVLVTAGTVLFALFLLAPWVRREGFDLGSGHRVEAASADGLDSGLLVTALLLLVAASCWSLLPAFTTAAPPFPRALVTSALAALAFLLTLLEWLTDLDAGVGVTGLLAVLTAAAVLAVAVRQLVPQARAWVAAELHTGRMQDVT
jgi:hypothetical protein